ncbi:MAG: DcaP family trimeric outer membrane transporter, partial [Pyrinomonadaceae bacterium]
MKSKQRVWAGVFILALFSIGLLIIPAKSTFGQSQDQPKPKTESEILKERLQQLEQTVSELKAQLDSIEGAKKNPQPVIVEATYKPGADATAAVDPAVPVKPKKDDPKGESSVEIYGFAMLDAGYQFKANHPQWFDTLRVTKLPSFAGEFAPEGNTYWGVRQSRFGFKTSTPTQYGELKTIFEFELFGTGADAGQTTFRLRHAYGELGQFGAGQYWTVFGDTDTFPNSFEYWGPPGLIWYRNVGFRWMPLKGRNSITIGIERPGASADQGNYADRIALQGVKPKFNLPDFTGNFRMQRDWGHVQFSGMLRKISWVDTVDDDVDLSDTVWGYGGSVTSALNFGKNDVGRFSFVYGTGIQNYFNDAPTDVGI